MPLHLIESTENTNILRLVLEVGSFIVEETVIAEIEINAHLSQEERDRIKGVLKSKLDGYFL